MCTKGIYCSTNRKPWIFSRVPGGTVRSHSVWAILARGCGWLGRKVAFEELDVLAALAGSWRPLLTRTSPGYVTILVSPLQLSVQSRISCAFPRFNAVISVRRYALFLVGWSAVPWSPGVPSQQWSELPCSVQLICSLESDSAA